MAVIEMIGRPQVRLYIIAWGRLTEEDEGRLLARVLTARHADVTVDLCEVEEVTDRGCKAIKNVAAYMVRTGRWKCSMSLSARRLDHSSEPESLTTGESCLSLRCPLVG
jgi:hypothetical protein